MIASLIRFLLGIEPYRGRRDVDRRGRRRPLTTTLRLEPLEERSLLSTLNVTSAADSGPGTLRAQIAATNPGDTISFASSLNGATISLTSATITISKNGLTINGPTGSNAITLSGSNTQSPFTINPGANVTINNLNIIDGKGTLIQGTGGGGAITDNGTLVVNHCGFTSNIGAVDGGAVFVDAKAAFTANQCAFSLNSSLGTFSQSLGSGGGGAIYSTGPLTSLTLTNCTFDHNSDSFGTAVYTNGPTATATITGCKFSNNSDGNAVHLGGTADTITGCTFTNNTGGALGVSNTESNAVVTNCTFTQNTVAPTFGAFGGASGGVTNDGILTLTNSTFDGNVSDNGAAVSNGSTGILSLLNSTFINNQARTAYCVMSSVGILHMRSCTLANNVANGGIPGLSLSGNGIFFDDNIFDDPSGDLTSIPAGATEGYNLFVSSPPSGTSPTDILNTSPLLSFPLASKGGPTQTLALQAGSPCIDAGDPIYATDPNYVATSLPAPTTDQRGPGFNRIVNGRVDIGAYEYNSGNGGGGGNGGSGGTGGGSGGSTPSGPVTSIYAVGTDAGPAPHVQVYNAANNQLLYSLMPYSSAFTGGVRVAVGDVNGDGTPDIVTVPGPGGASDIKVFNGATGQQMDEFFAFNPSFTGGCNLALGDVNGDGDDDIVVGAGAGGGPVVTVFSGKDNSVLDTFFAFAPAFTGGVRVATGDVNGNGQTDVICGAGSGGGPVVEVYNGANGNLLNTFFAFSPLFTGGIYLAAGDTNNSGQDNIIVGAGAGGGPVVAVFLGNGVELQSFFAYNASFLGGVRVAAVSSGTSPAAILTAAGPDPTTYLDARLQQQQFDLQNASAGGPNTATDVDTYNGMTGVLIDTLFTYDPPFSPGLYVAGTAL